jgi:hypothetical protein
MVTQTSNMRLRTPHRPAVRTRISCTRTEGYNAKPGVHYYEWCPFCGRRTDGADHELLVTATE